MFGTLTHLTNVFNGPVVPSMVNVANKSLTLRAARAEALLIIHGGGTTTWWPLDVASEAALVSTAVIAGVNGAKACGSLIPMCHPLPLARAAVSIERPTLLANNDAIVRITSDVSTVAGTGVEMEALCAVSLAALTLIDMLKGALPPGSLEISNIRLLHKSGGKRDFDTLPVP